MPENKPGLPEERPSTKKNILLGVTPFWDPLIPPQGIASLKRYLQEYGYRVRAADINRRDVLLEMYDIYFDFIKKNVPEDNWGNLYSIGHFVLQNQVMAHFNRRDEERYAELVKILVYKTFYTRFNETQVLEMKKIVDEFLSRLNRCLTGLIEEENPDIFGLTVNTGTFPVSLYSFKYVREQFPHIMTVMGGSIFADQLAVDSPNYRYFLKKTEPYLDKIFIGPGEILFHRFLEGELPRSQRVYSKKDINGKSLGFSDLELPDLSDYDVASYPYLAATGSISCKYQCSFCNSAAYWGEYRQKEPRQTVAEMIALNRQYGFQLFFMTDAMINPFVEELAQEVIASGVPLYYDAYFKVDEDSGDLDKVLPWREGGFYRARIGVETGSQQVLDLIDKEVTVDQTRTAVANLAQAGIKTTTYWVIGHPGETEEDFLQTLGLLEELRNDIWQAECAQFDYYYAGQTRSDHYARYRRLTYPRWAKSMLISQAYTVDREPSREVTYRRLYRFARQCKKLGIPNPYTFQEIRQADLRWTRLHKNAVPPLLEFKRRDVVVREHTKPRKFVSTRTAWTGEGDFGF